MTIPKTVALPLGDTPKIRFTSRPPLKRLKYIYDIFFILARVFFKEILKSSFSLSFMKLAPIKKASANGRQSLENFAGDKNSISKPLPYTNSIFRWPDRNIQATDYLRQEESARFLLKISLQSKASRTSSARKSISSLLDIIFLCL